VLADSAPPHHRIIPSALFYHDSCSEDKTNIISFSSSIISNLEKETYCCKYGETVKLNHLNYSQWRCDIKFFLQAEQVVFGTGQGGFSLGRPHPWPLSGQAGQKDRGPAFSGAPSAP